MTPAEVDALEDEAWAAMVRLMQREAEAIRSRSG
jgi:hypothetical protein